MSAERSVNPEVLTPALDNIQKEVLQSETLEFRRATGLKKASFLLSALAAAGLLIYSLPIFQQPSSAHGAENSPTPTLSPRPTETATPTPEAKREIQLVQNPIEFTYMGQQYEWFRSNARYGIPPNNPNTPIGTIDVSINGNYQYSFQLKQSIYPVENTAEGRSINIAGQIADTQTGKGFLATTYGTAEGWKLALETISAINNSTDYSETARTLTIQGLESIILNGTIVNSFYLSTESGTNYINIEITNASDTAKNGTYRFPRDSEGKPVPPAQKQEADTPTPTKTPTLTTTLTPTPTNGTPTLGPVATFGTNRDPETRIHIPVSLRKPPP